MKNLLGALLIAISMPVFAALEGNVQVFERAEIPIQWGWDFPDEDRASEWTSVALPHNWHRDPPPGSRDWNRIGVWYRIQFTLDYTPYASQSIYLARLPLSDLVVYVNRRAIWQKSDYYARGSRPGPGLIPIPLGILRKGENVIHLRAVGYANWYPGVPRVYLGNTRLLAERAGMRGLIQLQTITMGAAAFGAIGLLALWLWMRGGRDPVLFWYAVSGISLFVATAFWYLTQWRYDGSALRAMLVFLRFNGYLMPLLILHLRLARIKKPWLEAVLWVALVAAVASIAIPGRWQWLAWSGWGILFAALPAFFIIPLVSSPELRRQPAVVLLLVADVAAALMNLHDWALRLGWVDFDRPHLIYYVAPFVMLAAAVPIMARPMAGIAATRRMNVELERRVEAKAREIEATHAQLQQVQRAQVLADERQRIMVDMHDGLGSRLVGLLSVAQSGKARPEELSEGIAAALDELRLTVDSVQPVEGDVGVVLGNVRHRMRSVFERAGVRFLWNVSALPRMDDLTPERIRAIQRIFLEVFSNALKHAGARTVAVSAARVPEGVQIVIADDGRGFEPGAGHTGIGLANLQLRATQAGGALAVESSAGKGTRVTLSLPLADDEPPDQPATRDRKADYPIPGISPAPTKV